MKLSIRLEIHPEFKAELKHFARRDPARAVAVVTVLQNARIAGGIVEDEWAIVNHSHLIFALGAAPRAMSPIVIVDTSGSIDGVFPACAVDRVEIRPFARHELIRMASRYARMIGVVPHDVFIPRGSLS